MPSSLFDPFHISDELSVVYTNRSGTETWNSHFLKAARQQSPNWLVVKHAVHKKKSSVARRSIVWYVRFSSMPKTAKIRMRCQMALMFDKRPTWQFRDRDARRKIVLRRFAFQFGISELALLKASNNNGMAEHRSKIDAAWWIFCKYDAQWVQREITVREYTWNYWRRSTCLTSFL